MRAGAGVTTALKHIADQAEPPISQEFGLMLREQRMGVTFTQSLSNLCERMPSEAASLVCAALGIAARTGGSLSETLDRIADTVRRAQVLRGKIRAMTAQGRLQAWVVGALPPALAVVINQISPGVMDSVWTTPLGCSIAVSILVLEGVGMVWIHRIVDIDV